MTVCPHSNDPNQETLPAGVGEGRERRKVSKRVNDDLNPLAYATAYRDTGGKLGQLKERLVSIEYQQKFDAFRSLVESKAQKNFYERSLAQAKDWTHKTTDDMSHFLKDIIGSIQGDPEVEHHWQELVSFDKTNAQVSGAVLMYDHLSGGMQTRVAEEYQGMIDGKKQGFKKFSGKAWAYAQPVVITNIIMQPAVLSAVGGAVDLAKSGLYKGGEVFKNVIAGVTQGDLIDEIWHIGRDGDPIEYLWNGRSIKDRKMDKLKDPKIIETPEKLKKYMNGETQYFFYAMERYPTEPEKVRKQVPDMAKFSYRAMASSMSDLELRDTVKGLQAGEWNSEKVRRATSMSVSGAMLKFFLETASSVDRELFFSELKRIQNQKFKPGGFTNVELQKKFPGINDQMTKKDKGMLRSALSSGVSGIAFGTFVFTQLLAKMFFSVSKDPFQFFGEWSEQGPKRVMERYSKSWKIKKNQLQKFSARETDKFYAYTKKKQYDKKFKMFSRKDGILSGKEVKNLLGKKITNTQRRKISEEVDEFLKDRRRPKIKADEFWNLKTIKSLKSKELREEVLDN